MTKKKQFDAVILGAGPGGRGVAKRLAKAGCSVAMVEQELVGGECPFWACIPSQGAAAPGRGDGRGRATRPAWARPSCAGPRCASTATT